MEPMGRFGMFDVWRFAGGHERASNLDHGVAPQPVVA